MLFSEGLRKYTKTNAIFHFNWALTTQNDYHPLLSILVPKNILRQIKQTGWKVGEVVY